jgi:hypothetical protein
VKNEDVEKVERERRAMTVDVPRDAEALISDRGYVHAHAHVHVHVHKLVSHLLPAFIPPAHPSSVLSQSKPHAIYTIPE